MKTDIETDDDIKRLHALADDAIYARDRMYYKHNFTWDEIAPYTKAINDICLELSAALEARKNK